MPDAAITFSQQGHINLSNSENREKLHCEFDVTKGTTFSKDFSCRSHLFSGKSHIPPSMGGFQRKLCSSPGPCAVVMGMQLPGRMGGRWVFLFTAHSGIDFQCFPLHPWGFWCHFHLCGKGLSEEPNHTLEEGTDSGIFSFLYP